MFEASLGGGHLLQLVHGPLQAVLHAIAEIEVGFPYLVVWHCQYSLHILQCKPVPFYSFKSLCASDQCFHILWLNLQNRGAVRDCSIEI